METETDAYISFLRRKVILLWHESWRQLEKIGSIVDEEIAAFRNDPVAAYEASEPTAESLVTDAEQAEPFALPSGWISIEFPDADESILHTSRPGHGAFGDEGQFKIDE